MNSILKFGDFLSESSNPDLSNQENNLAVIGYMFEFGPEIEGLPGVSAMDMSDIKHELRTHLLNLRDKKPVKELSKNAMVLYNALLKSVNQIANKSKYIESGKRLKVTVFGSND